ncbi:MAG: hypothetical protein ACOYJ3_06370, partial [Candidatus Planktophila sp.]
HQPYDTLSLHDALPISEDASSVRALEIQDEISTLSDANCFIALSEKDESIEAGASVNVVVLERRYI